MQDFDFANDLDCNVEVYHDDYGFIGEGELAFGGGKVVCIQLDLRVQDQGLQGKYSVLRAKTRDGRHFTLFICEIDAAFIYADFIACGNVRALISGFHVKYARISDWFLHGQYLDGQLGENLTWKNQPPQLSVAIRTAGEDFSLRTETVSSLVRRGEDQVIHEHTRFVFERTNGVFSIEEVKGKTFEFSTLLSLLTATPVSIENVWVCLSSGYPIPLYFPAFKKVEPSSGSGAYWLSCLAQRHSLDGKWQSIVERFYASCYQKSSWVRLAGMQRYEGFWEFKILGYVSLLDEYVSTYASNANQKATKAESKKVTKLKEQIRLLQQPLGADLVKEVESLIESVFVTSRELTFREKYDYAKSLTNEDILRVINLTDHDFSLIKRIRDKVAHGAAPDLSDTSHQELHVIVEKITLLMTYWAHADLGFSPPDFAASLKFTHNRLHLNPGLDKIHIDRITKSAEFISVPESLFGRFSSGQLSIVNACFIQGLKGELTYSENHKSMYDAWIRDRARTSNQLADAFGLEVERVGTIGTLYLECGDKTIRLYMAFIIKGV